MVLDIVVVLELVHMTIVLVGIHGTVIGIITCLLLDDRRRTADALLL